MFDPNKLPQKALIDSGVLIRFMGDKPSDPRTPDCVGFVSSMINSGRSVIVSPNTWAEFLRGRSVTTPPVTLGFRIVAFDEEASFILGTRMNMNVLRTAKSSSGTSLTYIKYDAMIAACALRYKADCIVSIDSDFDDYCMQLGIPRRRPEDFKLSPVAAVPTASSPIARP